MRSRSFFRKTLLPVMLVVAILSYHRAIRGQETGRTAEEGSAQRIPIPAASGSPMAAADGEAVGALNLRIDGKIPGRVSMLGPTGSLKPARAKIHFIRKGTVVTSARSDEWGHFQASGLQPGVYSVIAVSREGFGVLSVDIRPFDESAAKEQSTVFQVGLSHQASMSLDMTLVPTEEFDLLAEMLNEELTDLAEPQAAPFAGGAGGGGGGGGGGDLGGLLGAAGLAAGVSALATQGRSQASPSTP